MARGVFSGLIWGAVVAGVGAGGLSLAYPDFKPGAQQTAMGEAVPAASPSDATPVQETASAPESDVAAEPETKSDPAIKSGTSEPAASEEAIADSDAPESGEGEEVAQGAGAEEGGDLAEPEVMEPEVTEPETGIAENTAQGEVMDEESASADETASEAPEAPSENTAEVTEPAEDDQPAEQETAAQTDPATSITDQIIAALPKSEGTVGDLAPEVKTDRLPSLADPEEPAADAPSAVAPPPIKRFAAEFTADEGKPLMAIVLMDEGDSALGVEALAAFPYPITFAVDASLENAAERMQIYRDKGFEVMALAGLPQGATASDAEVAMSAYLSAVPEAVAILETPDVSLQANREVTDQITKIVLESGHGLVLQANGLNTAQKLARREGIPSASVFRDFDGKDQKASVIRRFLDQAAFKAGQEGGVIMLGRLRAETISALLIWGLADRASRVALVPVSAVLLKEDSAG
mgnify:CR=1 FL=1